MKKILMMIGAAAAVGAMLPLSAMADAVRVYDVDDYVQDGLVAHHARRVALRVSVSERGNS